MKEDKLKIAVFGLGYVGMSLSTLFAMNPDKCDVVAIDIDEGRVQKVNNKQSTIEDKAIEDNLPKINLQAYTKIPSDYIPDFVVICTPTNFDPNTGHFNTKSIESVIACTNAHCYVIKSTIPIGYTEELRKKFGLKILFSPEFLREGKSLEDNLIPTRIIVGNDRTEEDQEFAYEFGHLLSVCSQTHPEPILMGLSEAESIKLYSNAFLATKVAFFNEIDNFCMLKGLNSKEVISGITKDPRIRSSYAVPSFGYGGYCLPKDTKQLEYDYLQASCELRFPLNCLISSVINSNSTRIQYIADYIVKNTNTDDIIGIYKLAMKPGSDNYRESSILEVARLLKGKNRNILIYDLSLPDNSTFTYKDIEYEYTRNLGHFKNISKIILSNFGVDDNLKDVEDKVFTRFIPINQ